MANQFQHYYTASPKSDKKYYRIKQKIQGIDLDLKTCSGIYSPLHIDRGSIVHLKFAKIREGDKIMDLGCGYGTIGVWIGKKYPKTEIYMTDVNERAVECAKENAINNKIRAKVVQGDGFEHIKDKDFDVVLLNPPIQAGLKVCYRLIAESFSHLAIGGTLQVVLRPREGGQRILKKMKAIFGNSKSLGKEGIYEVYLAKKEKNEPFSEYDRIKYTTSQ